MKCAIQKFDDLSTSGKDDVDGRHASKVGTGQEGTHKKVPGTVSRCSGTAPVHEQVAPPCLSRRPQRLAERVLHLRLIGGFFEDRVRRLYYLHHNGPEQCSRVCAYTLGKGVGWSSRCSPGVQAP
jgi:hypothetical protein